MKNTYKPNTMKKTLQECKEIVAKNYGFNDWGGLRVFSLKFEQFTDLANKMYYEQSEWISVEDALPEPLIYVLGFNGFEYKICDKNFIQLFNYTHWQPLPNPPQK